MEKEDVAKSDCAYQSLPPWVLDEPEKLLNEKLIPDMVFEEVANANARPMLRNSDLLPSLLMRCCCELNEVTDRNSVH